jgi:hypothetical protein
MTQEQRISQLQTTLKEHFGYCKINRGREAIHVFYGKPQKFHQILKSDLDGLTDEDIIKELKQ